MTAWIHSVTQPPPDDLEKRLFIPRQRIPIIASLIDLTAAQRWQAEGAPDAVVYIDGSEVEVLLADDDVEVIVRAPWIVFFIEAWTAELDREFEHARRAVSAKES